MCLMKVRRDTGLGGRRWRLEQKAWRGSSDLFSLSSPSFSSSIVIHFLTLCAPKAPQRKECLGLLNLWEDKEWKGAHQVSYVTLSTGSHCILRDHQVDPVLSLKRHTSEELMGWHILNINWDNWDVSMLSLQQSFGYKTKE